MSAWITTIPLHSGAIPANNYACTITGLLPATAYEYRAYMIVDGDEYYGNICQITTSPIPTHAPYVCTGVAYSITDNSMGICNNCVTDKGNLNVNEYGILYTQVGAYASDLQMVYGNPNICKQSISADIAVNTGYFTGAGNLLTGLLPNVETYYRSFAKNTVGNGYGSIGTQLTAPSPIFQEYGYLYNYYTLINAGGIAPTGWHVPSDAEWHALSLIIDPTSTLILGNESATAGGKLKEVGTAHWTNPNVGATDLYGFAGRGGGHRNGPDGEFQQMKNTTTFATTTAIGGFSYWYRSIFAANTILYRNHDYMNSGFSIRLVKDNPLTWNLGDTVTDVDGNVYNTVKIGNNIWTTSNFKATHYNNGNPIPNLVDDVSWTTTFTGGYSVYVL